MSDLIDRQAAIDALKQQADTMSGWSERYAEQRKGVLTAVNIVEDLPSAQPELRCGHEGRGMIKRNFDEMIAYFNRTVADMDIDQKYKMILLGIITAIGQEHEWTKPHWIPVTERLPEDEEDVLVTYKTTDKIHPCQYHADGSKNPWYSYIDKCRAYMNVVLAWMPLPEPYKGDKT